MITATETPVDVDPIDLADLDLLDDGKRHAHCPTCTPVRPFVPFVAYCGRRAIYHGHETDVREPPPNACPDCLPTAMAVAAGAPCPRCGATLR